VVSFGRFAPEKITPGTRWLGCWVEPRAGLDVVAKGRSLLLPGIESRVAIPFTEVIKLIKCR